MVYRQPQWKLAACLVSLVACAPGVHQQTDAFAPAPPAGASTLVVRNDYFGDMDVYAVVAAHARALARCARARLRVSLLTAPW